MVLPRWYSMAVAGMTRARRLGIVVSGVSAQPDEGSLNLPVVCFSANWLRATCAGPGSSRTLCGTFRFRRPRPFGHFCLSCGSILLFEAMYSRHGDKAVSRSTAETAPAPGCGCHRDAPEPAQGFSLSRPRPQPARPDQEPAGTGGDPSAPAVRA